MKNTKMYSGYRYPSQVISHAVWLYHRFTLSFRDIEELLAARRIVASYEAIRHGVVNNLFWLGRHSMKASYYRVFCDRVFVEWSRASCVQNLT